MKEVSIKFVDFWPSLDIYNNKFVKALESKYKVTVLASDSKDRPDLLIYSIFGIDHYKYSDCVKIYFTGENDVPDFNECDYALSFHRIDFGSRHLRYPLYTFYEFSQALNPPTLTDAQALERGFCTLLMRNDKNCAAKRLQTIDAVEAYKPVAYGGPYRNNIGGLVPVDGKISFISKYKFNLALENSSIPGYVTEKIVEAFAAPTVPIYWGAPDVAEDFNPESYINVNDYPDLDAFISDLRDIDNNPQRYLSMLRSPRLREEAASRLDEALADFLGHIVENPVIQRPRNAMGEQMYQRNWTLRRFGSHDKILRLLTKIYGTLGN